MKSIFDKYAKEYNEEHQKAVSASGFDIEHFYEYKIKEVYRIYSKRKTKTPVSILDFGCGVGNVDPYLRKYFPNANIYGVDISAESIKIANEKHKASDVTYAVFDVDSGNSLPFDLVFAACVFHHNQEVSI